MNQFYAFVDANPQGIPLLLSSLLLVLLGTLVGRLALLRRDLKAAPDAIARWTPNGGEATPGPICEFAAAYLLSPERVSLDVWPEGRLLSSREASELFDEYAERRLSTVRFALASSATGIALFFTFFLIAHVIATNIPSALDAASSATANTDELKTAMKLLGQKFAISATGIFFAVVFAGATSAARRIALASAHEASRRAAHLFCTPASLAASAQLVQLRSEQASTTHLEDIRSTMAGMRSDLAKLQSIEVSVKDMGAEVSIQLQRMLKEDLGEQIKEILVDVMRQASDMSDRLRSELIDGFQRTLETEIPKVLESLQAIRHSVEGQASSPVERMLEQLQALVSGGMQGETAQMSAALRQFAEVVPALAMQLQDVAQTMTRDMRERSHETTRMTESLLTQVGGLLARLETQQSATDRAIAEIAQASSAGAAAMMARLEAGSAEMMGGMLRTSRTEIDGLLGRLQEVATASAQGYGSIEESVGAAARSIIEARDGLAAAAESIRALSHETRGVIADARQSSDAAHKAAASFEGAAGLLRAGVDGMRNAIEQGRTYGAEQQAVIAEHRRLLGELEQLWPKLFETYLRSFDEKSTLLARSWNELYNQVGKLSETVGGGLSEAAEDLKASVDRLAAVNNGGRA